MVAERERLILEAEQPQNIFSIVRTNLHTWLNRLSLGADDVSTELRKSGDECKT
jgi:hypothetical protein